MKGEEHKLTSKEEIKSIDEVMSQNVSVYDKTASQMADRFNDIGARVKEVALTFSYVSKKDNPQVIEIGSGNGREAVEILKYTHDYTGIDVSQGMVDVARDTLPDTNFIVSDIESYIFTQDIDVVFSFASLLHLDKPAFTNLLSKVHKALAEGGIFSFTIKEGEYGQRAKTDEYGTRYYYFYTADMIKEMVADEYVILQLFEKIHRGQNWINIILKKK